LNDPQPQPETVSIEVRYLADCPESVRPLALWLYEEWGRRNPDNSVEKVERRLMQRMNRDKVPLTLVAFRGAELVGSASLIIREMETHPQFLHWLGGLYIHHPYRNQGIGSRLVEYAASEAERLGVRELYLYTRHHESFYSRLGWRPVERAHYHGREVLIMKRGLGLETLAQPQYSPLSWSRSPDHEAGADRTTARRSESQERGVFSHMKKLAWRLAAFAVRLTESSCRHCHQLDLWRSKFQGVKKCQGF
jgi:predicted N-acetyltransferase YhbS